MGQMLSIGIMIEITFSKSEMIKGKLTTAEILEKMGKTLFINPNIYVLEEKEDNIYLRLKDEILEKELVPFLEKIYPQLYLNITDSDYTEVLDTLRKEPLSEWENLAKRKRYCSYQFDNYSESQILYFDKPFLPKIHLNSKEIMLSAEGKIVMEEYGRQFNFLKYCMVCTFKEYLLASALRVYITG